MRCVRIGGFSAVSLALLGASGDASAYNNREHQRLPDQAYQIMNVIRRGEYLTGMVNTANSASFAPLSSRPTSIPPSEQAKWDRFIQEVREAPDRLDRLQVALPNPKNPNAICGNRYPVMTTAGARLGQCRAGELTFAPARGYNQNDASCYFRPGYRSGDGDRPYFFDPLTSNYTGALLGYYAQQVDDDANDTIMWARPLNSGALGVANEFAKTANTFALTVLAAPVACFIALFSGSNCIDDAVNLSRAVEPVGLVESAIPYGIGRIDGDDIVSTTGVWHFINVESPDRGDFNTIGGMHYTQGGWRGGPDVFGIGRIDSADYAIIVGTDALGIGLNPDESDGVKKYQQDPDGRLIRRNADWLSNLGHVEFEPLDNLALYGWRNTGSAARGLGWVLHAIGDAVAPHHTIAATGWGHRPYEDFAGFAWKEMFFEGGASDGQYLAVQPIVKNAYLWWSYFDDWQQAHPGSDLPIRDFITTLAYETNAMSDWAFKSGISVEYIFKEGDENKARSFYAVDRLKTKEMLQRGTGATMAFLTKAARTIRMSTASSPCQCDPGYGRGRNVPTGQVFMACQKCSEVQQVELNGQCVTACPSDKPLLTPEGRCVGSCPTANCTGVVCPPDAPYVSDGACVDGCPSAAPYVVNGRECRGSCPAGQVLTPGGKFCGPDSRCTVEPRSDTNAACGNCAPPTPFLHQGQCLPQCPTDAPYRMSGSENATNASCFTRCPDGTIEVLPHVCQAPIIK